LNTNLKQGLAVGDSRHWVCHALVRIIS